MKDKMVPLLVFPMKQNNKMVPLLVYPY